MNFDNFVDLLFPHDVLPTKYMKRTLDLILIDDVVNRFLIESQLCIAHCPVTFKFAQKP